MPRMMTQGAAIPAEQIRNIADQRALGCRREMIGFNFPDQTSYMCEREKRFAEAVLERNQSSWPAFVMFPTNLSPELIYAQCSFKHTLGDDYNYKETAGIHVFLAAGGSLSAFIAEYGVVALFVGPQALADSVYALDEPLVQHVLYALDINSGAVKRYIRARLGR